MSTIEHLRDYHYPKVYKAFLSEVEDHEMTAVHDDGLHRHLRFAKPGTGMWHFDIITWPGHLATSGDIADGFMFSRLADMFDFFEHGQGDGEINPGYWAEKMPHHIKRKSFSSDLFDRIIREDWEDRKDEYTDEQQATIWEHVECSLIGQMEYAEEAYEALRDFEVEGYSYSDIYEWEFDDYDYHFLLALHAILWGIKKYKAAKS
jgi:hypothetical protein